MIFAKADIDTIVQIDDMFRIDAERSFFTAGEVITELNIYPDFDNNPATVFNVYVADCPEDWYLDWAYAAAADYSIKVEMKTATDTVDRTYIISAITAATDNLQSDDSLVYARESELKKNIPYGRNSWKYLHREALKEIIDYLYRNGKRNAKGDKIEKEHLIGDKLEQWSLFETMILIYQEIKVSDAQLFVDKLEDYTEARNRARDIYLFSYDSDADGDVDDDDVDLIFKPKFYTR